jgi:hypothetical protein
MLNIPKLGNLADQSMQQPTTHNPRCRIERKEWTYSVAIEPVDNTHRRVGKTYKETLRLPTGRDERMSIKVVESQSPDLFVTEGTFAPVHPRMEIRLLAKSAQETILSLKFFSRSQSTIGRFLIATFVSKIFARQSDVGLRQLKNVLEEGMR